MSLNDCIGKTLKPWPILVDHYIKWFRASHQDSLCSFKATVHLLRTTCITEQTINAQLPIAALHS